MFPESLDLPVKPAPAENTGHMEVEIKLPVADLAAALERIREAGYRETAARSFESNVLFDTDDQALRRNQQALRLREYGGQTILTLKGKPQEGRHKQREELETQVGSGAVITLLLERLGYKPVFRYEKYRHVYAREGEPGLITVDETPLGPYLELEGDSDWIDRTATQLGFGPDDYITAPYAAIYLEYCRTTGIEPAHFVFPAADAETPDANG